MKRWITFATNQSTIRNIISINHFPVGMIFCTLREGNKYPKLVSRSNLEVQYDRYFEHRLKIESIDKMIFETNGSEEISINKNPPDFAFTRTFTENLSRGLRPITGISGWDSDQINVFTQVWDKLFGKKSHNLVSYRQNIEKIRSDELRYLGKRVIGNLYFSGHQIYDAWNQLTDDNTIKRLLEDIATYRLVDHSLAYYYLVKQRNKHAEAANQATDRSQVHYNELKQDMEISDSIQINQYLDFAKFFPEYQFDQVIRDKEYGQCMQTVHRIVTSIPGAREWVIKTHKTESDNKIYWAIIFHPSLNGVYLLPQISWSLHSLRYIYINGWINWVKMHLDFRGLEYDKYSVSQNSFKVPES